MGFIASRFTAVVEGNSIDGFPINTRELRSRVDWAMRECPPRVGSFDPSWLDALHWPGPCYIT